MNDTTNIEKVSIMESLNENIKMSWEPYFLAIGILTLVAAIGIPLWQKWHEQKRAKDNFNLYLKKQLGGIYNLITQEKIEYTEPSIKNDISKELISPVELSYKIESDYHEHRESVQPRTIFMLLLNLQKLLLFNYQLRHVIGNVDFKNITEQTLVNGNRLRKKDLSAIYGLILILESFQSISLFHDRFDNLKTIKRTKNKDFWTGFKLEKDFLKKQELLNDDLLHINDNENSIIEISNILRIVDVEVRKFMEQDINKK